MLTEPAKGLTKRYEEYKEAGKRRIKSVVCGKTIDPCKKDRVLSPEGQML